MSHHHEGEQNQPKLKKTYWKSSEEFSQALSKDPNRFSLPSGEFKSVPDNSNSDGSDGHSRREFFKIMGASLAMMGASGCTRRPIEHIVPYVKKPEDITPGIANWYTSTCGECDSGCGILVKSREGRPIKFEGNPSHPVSQGGLCARGQASVLNVYDPDRLKSAIEVGRRGSDGVLKWDDLDAKVLAKLQSARQNGGRVRVLTGEISSPSTNKLVAEFLAGFSGGHRVTFEPLGAEEVAAASELAYGSRVVPHYNFDKAEMVVSFGADFLGTWLSPVEFSKKFSKTRKVGVNGVTRGNKHMSRFVAFESLMTLTGSNADERFRVKSGDEYKVAMALAHELIVTQAKTRFAGDSVVRGVLAQFAPASIAANLGVSAEVLRETAKELWEARGKSLVVGGGQTAKGDAGIALEVAVNLLNSALENDGVTVDGTASPATDRSSYADLVKLISDMKAGGVDVLLIYKSNPVYTLPKSLGFEDALKKVGLVVTFSEHLDETAQASDFVASTPHHTEAWGDANPYAGVYSVQQPTISPLYQTRDFEASLMVWAKKLGLGGAITTQPNWHEYLVSNWKETVAHQHAGSTPFQLFWENTLREGFVGTLRTDGHARSFNASALRAIPGATWSKGFTLALYPKISQYDGRNANNGWLQELPDPVTKVTWDNYVLISPAAAQKMGVAESDVLRVKTASGTLELPAFLQPGLHDETVGIALGYGRDSSRLSVASGVGKNAFLLAVAGEHDLGLSALPATVEKTGATYALAATQHHSSMEGRAPVREAPLEEYRKDAKAGNESEGEPVTLWSRHEYPGYRWGMSIDLNSCTGCSACVIGCQSENNIPVVGKRFVLDSKEMHWLRIDRYYSGNVAEPETVHQPMLCQHCENAPCETVCPVLATMHDHEGLNQQVYNRCVGTRYCANNCPYKVRRFNWFTFTDDSGISTKTPQNLAMNPDLTVRTRGVMEKCTFCMQRVREAKDRAKDMGAVVKDGELKTACQQSCPTDAIVFGNINDPNSRVSMIAADPRGYHVLEELNTRPSITYLTKIRNSEQRSES